MHFRPEVIPYIWSSLAVAGIVGLAVRVLRRTWRAALATAAIVAVLLIPYFLYFFRDPERVSPADPAALVAGADGTIMAITEMQEPTFLKTNVVRISIFLSLIDVHVNRAPVAGRIAFAQYYPGKRYFTFQEKSSEFNQHSSILIEGGPTRCLVNQIVGPVARRVVYWLDVGQAIGKGDRIGMMKFGSRLDMYFPRDEVEVRVARGDKVRAGETIVAVVKAQEGRP